MLDFTRSILFTLVALSSAAHASDFNGLVERAESNCFSVNIDDIMQLPGWPKVQDYINTQWGDDYDRLLVNPEQYPDAWVNVCSVEGVTPIILDEQPRCETRTQMIGGTTENVRADIQLSSSQESTSTTALSIVNECQISAGSSISVKMGLPGIGGLEASVSTELTLTNSLGTSSEFTQLQKTGQSGTFESYAGERCLLELNVTTCTVTGHGSQKMVASGHVWANYGHRVNGAYHKKTLLEKHLSEAERTFTLEFKSSTSTTSRTDYYAECKPLNPPPTVPDAPTTTSNPDQPTGTTSDPDTPTETSSESVSSSEQDQPTDPLPDVPEPTEDATTSEGPEATTAPPTETTRSEPGVTTTNPPTDPTPAPAPEPTTTPAPPTCTDANAPATVTVIVTAPASTLTVYAKPTPCPACPGVPAGAL